MLLHEWNMKEALEVRYEKALGALQATPLRMGMTTDHRGDRIGGKNEIFSLF